MTFAVRFWGVRGSIACPSPHHIRYGGNTSCVELVAGERRVILDAGTGIRPLGQQFFREGIGDATILLTHTHWDHINGFPFFGPAYDSDRAFRVMAGHLSDGGVRRVLANQMHNPMFPVPLEEMRARLDLEDFTAGESFRLAADLEVRTAALNHPDGATGYRIDHAGKSICYVTDTEHVPGKPDARVLALIEGADVVIYDSTYTEEEFPGRIGWGHSTWNEGMRLCREAGAKKLLVFHHDPDHDDAFMDALAAEARQAWSEIVVAREGMTCEA